MALHGAVSTLASLAEVRAWRQMAVMLKVAVVTPQWAEALVKGGVTSILELRRLDLDELQAVFEKARDERTIDSVPSTQQLAVMLKDAAVLDYAGAVTGTVTDRDGAPVPEASASAAGSDAITDPRGRFRLRRLRLGGSVELRIAKDGYEPTVSQVPPLPTATVRVQEFRLLPAVVQRPRASGESARPLSELRGDAMPAMRGHEVTSTEVTVESLEPGDLLTLMLFYADNGDAKLVSKLLEFDGSRFVVRWVRVPARDLPTGADLGAHYMRTSNGFRPVAISPPKLNEYKRLLQAGRGLPARPGLQATERYDRAVDLFRAMAGGRQ